MACIHQCEVCGGNVPDRNMHIECEIAFLSDILYQVQAWLVSLGPRKNNEPFPEELAKIIGNKHFRTLREFKDKRGEDQNLESKQAMWLIGLEEYLRRAEEEFRHVHPEPKPMTF